LARADFGPASQAYSFTRLDFKSRRQWRTDVPLAGP